MDEQAHRDDSWRTMPAASAVGRGPRLPTLAGSGLGWTGRVGARLARRWG